MNNGRKLRLAIDMRLWKGDTGIARYSLSVAEYYMQRYSETFEIVLLTNDADRVRKKFPGFAILKVDLKPFSILDVMRMGSVLRRESIAVYHSLFYSSVFFRLPSIFVLTTVHDLMYRQIKGFFGPSAIKNFFARAYYDCLVSRSLLNSDAVIAISECTRQGVYNWLGIDSHLIRNGIDVSYFLQKRALPSGGFPNLTSRGFFLFVGNQRPHKNLDFLLDAYSRTTQKIPLVICGPKNTRYKIAAKNRGNVVFLSNVSDSDLTWLYTHCEAFILPSLSEGFGMPILEATLCDAKIFSSNGGALREFSDDYAYFFDPNNIESLIYLIENSQSLKRKHVSIERIKSEYSWQRHLTKIDEILNPIIAHR